MVEMMQLHVLDSSHFVDFGINCLLSWSDERAGLHACCLMVTTTQNYVILLSYSCLTCVDQWSVLMG